MLKTASMGASLSETNCATWRMVFSFDKYGKIKGTAHQIHSVYLAVLVNALCDLVKAHAPLRRYLYLDQRNYLFLTGIIPVDQGMITADNMLFFHICNLICHCNLTFAQ